MVSGLPMPSTRPSMQSVAQRLGRRRASAKLQARQGPTPLADEGRDDSMMMPDMSPRMGPPPMARAMARPKSRRGSRRTGGRY